MTLFTLRTRGGIPSAIFTGREIQNSGGNNEDKNGAEKTDKLNDEISPALFDAGNGGDFNSAEIKDDNLPAVSEKNIENGGIIKAIKNYWAYLIKRIKKHIAGVEEF